MKFLNASVSVKDNSVKRCSYCPCSGLFSNHCLIHTARLRRPRPRSCPMRKRRRLFSTITLWCWNSTRSCINRMRCRGGRWNAICADVNTSKDGLTLIQIEQPPAIYSSDCVRVASLSRPYHVRTMSVFHSCCPWHVRLTFAMHSCCPCHIRVSSVSSSATSVLHPCHDRLISVSIVRITSGCEFGWNLGCCPPRTTI